MSLGYTGSNLCYATLKQTSLYGAQMRETNASYANFSGANLT